MPFLGKSLEHDFLLFHIGIITMHWLGRSQKYRNGYFSFQNCSTTENDSKDFFFQRLPHKKANFVKKWPIEIGVQWIYFSFTSDLHYIYFDFTIFTL